MHAITLLQNDRVTGYEPVGVLLPYEFTLLQNQILYWCLLSLVLLPYEFTLLQNLKRGYLKLLPVQKSRKYTTPKPTSITPSIICGFTTL